MKVNGAPSRPRTVVILPSFFCCKKECSANFKQFMTLEMDCKRSRPAKLLSQAELEKILS